MATLPLAGEVSFEDGTLGAFNSETDVDGKLNVRHYGWLAKNLPYPTAVPYRGAYCAHINLAGGTNDAYYQENDFFDTALGGAVTLRKYFWAAGLVMASGDAFTIATLQSGAGTDEATIRVEDVSGVKRLVFAETGAIAIGAATRQTDLIQQAWHCLELVCVIDAGGGNDGTITAFCDGFQLGAAITGLDQAAITQARFGAIGIDAGTTAGHLLFDDIAGDTARIGPLSRRYSVQRILTQTGHFAVGPGMIHWANLLQSTALDETMQLFDTDVADTVDLSRRLIVFNDTGPVYFTQGVYAVLTGTNPVGELTLYECQDMDEGAVYALGRAR